jgi:hypothetical protein
LYAYSGFSQTSLAHKTKCGADSFYKPSLLARNYIIEAKQTVIANTPSGKQSLELLNTRLVDNSGTLAPQEFEVVVPRFSLDQGTINSYYPPDGHQDEGRILPHIVFNVSTKFNWYFETK